MSNLKQRELEHHLSKLQLASAAQRDIITEQHGKGGKQSRERAAQHEWEEMKGCLLDQRSSGIKLTLIPS